MKKIILPTTILMVVFLLAALIFGKFSFSKENLITPGFLRLKASGSQNLNHILGIENKTTPTPANPSLNFTAESVFAIDLTNKKIIYEKNSHQKHAIASLTKVMTAVVAYEHSIIENLITIPDGCNVGESEIGLTPGEKLTVNELIYGLILPSGNDAAEALARGISGDRNTFIGWMNQKAMDLGMKETYFANPSGLDEETLDKTTYSTAYDLYLLTKYALDFPYLKQVFATDSLTFPQNYRRKAYVFNNRLFLNQYYPYIKGIKPGNTDFAGYCLITLAEKNDQQILGVFLNSKDTRKDALALFNYALK